jgi:hypothetical protein
MKRISMRQTTPFESSCDVSFPRALAIAISQSYAYVQSSQQAFWTSCGWNDANRGELGRGTLPPWQSS